MDRRRFLRAAGLSTAVGVAGCVGGDSGGGSSATTETEPSTAAPDESDASGTAADANGTGLGDHPAAAGIENQPRRGELSGTAVVAFEDPSCSVCRRFHEGTVPRIQSNLVDSGEGAYVVRTYPVVYPWGKPATQALEATYARSEAAFFELLDYYFTNQSSLDGTTVLSETETFLTRTDVDGAAVRDDAESKAYDDAVQADLDAGRAADAGSVTPVVFLFKDGNYVSKASGSVSYDLIAAALDL